MTNAVSAGWFDCHVIAGAHPAQPHPTGYDVGDHLRRHRLGGALIGSMASWLHDPLTGNGDATAVAVELAEYGARPCWTAVPPTPGELADLGRLVQQAVGHGVAAFRLYPGSHGYSVSDPVWQPFFAALQHHRMVLCLNRTEIGWPDLEQIATRHPELPMIISLIGYRELRQLAAVLARRPNVFLDLANFATHQGVEWVVEHFGPHRLLFGSGFGLRDPGESIARLAWSGLDPEITARIGSGNADRLFGRQS